MNTQTHERSLRKVAVATGIAFLTMTICAIWANMLIRQSRYVETEAGADAGDVEASARAWIAWGKKNGYLE